MKIGIVGLGIVGSAVKFGFEKKLGHTIFYHDIKFKNTSLSKVYNNSELIFVCVSTPSRKNGSCDVSNVISVCSELNSLAKNSSKICDVVIKSTVDLGTTQKLINKFKNLRLAMNPEFLKEGAAMHDFCNQDICVIGTDNDGLYEKVVRAHGNLAKEYIRTSPINAEFVKYYSNVFNSIRIMFANLFYDLAQKFGADYNELKSIAVRRYNMIDYYLDCNQNLRGFGGSCLPKDVLAIKTIAKKLNLNYSFLKGLIEDNNKLNKKYPNSS